MLPVAHAAIGVLTYALIQLPREWRALTSLSVGAAFVGSQFPDLIDKTLAYYHVLPSGRSLAHSLLVLLALGVLLYSVTPERYRLYALAFWSAAVSHPLADAHQALLTQPLSGLPGYLLYPVTQAPQYGAHAAPWTRVMRIYSSPAFGIQTLALLTGVGVLLTGRAVLAVTEIGSEWPM